MNIFYKFFLFGILYFYVANLANPYLKINILNGSHPKIKT